jgi:hypothetical protein
VKKEKKQKKKHKANEAENNDDDREVTRAALRLQDRSHYAMLVGICVSGVYVKYDSQVFWAWDSDAGCVYGAWELDL